MFFFKRLYPTNVLFPVNDLKESEKCTEQSKICTRFSFVNPHLGIETSVNSIYYYTKKFKSIKKPSLNGKNGLFFAEYSPRRKMTNKKETFSCFNSHRRIQETLNLVQILDFCSVHFSWDLYRPATDLYGKQNL